MGRPVLHNYGSVSPAPDEWWRDDESVERLGHRIWWCGRGIHRNKDHVAREERQLPAAAEKAAPLRRAGADRTTAGTFLDAVVQGTASRRIRNQRIEKVGGVDRGDELQWGRSRQMCLIAKGVAPVDEPKA